MILKTEQETSGNTAKIPHLEAQRQGVVCGMSLPVEFPFYPSFTKNYSHVTFWPQWKICILNVVFYTDILCN